MDYETDYTNPDLYDESLSDEDGPKVFGSSRIAFEFISGRGAWRTVACGACGVAITDFTGSPYTPAERGPDGLYSNQSKHVAFHDRLGF